MRKKLLLCMLSVMILTALLPVKVHAALWDQQSGILKEVKPTDDNVYDISCAEELAWFSYRLYSETNSSLRDKLNKATLNFTSDIDLNSYNWRGIGENTGNWHGKIHGNNHVIRNMHAKSEGNGAYSCAFIDQAGSGFEAKDITFENCQSYMGERVGILVGCIEDGGGFTIENVHLVNCDVVGNVYVGGIVGWINKADKFTFNKCTIKSSKLSTTGKDPKRFGFMIGEVCNANGTIKNCYVNCRYATWAPRRSGAIIGKSWGDATDVTVEHCVVDINSHFFDGNNHDIGAIAGYVSHKSIIRADHCTILADAGTVAEFSTTSPYFKLPGSHGLLFGTNHDEDGRDWTGNIFISNCAVGSNYSSNDMHMVVAGSYSRSGDGSVHYHSDKSLYNGIGVDANIQNLSNAAWFNRNYGTRLGYNGSHSTDTYAMVDYLVPLTDKKEGALDLIDMPDNFTDQYESIYSEGLPKELVYSKTAKGNQVTLIDGQRAYFQLKKNATKWMVQDDSPYMSDKKRESKYVFSGVPTGEHSSGSASEIKPVFADRPIIALTGEEYNSITQVAYLKWDVQDIASVKKYWKDAKWVVERNGKDVASLPLETMEWTDNALDFDARALTYKIYLVDDAVCYEKSDNIKDKVPQYTFACSYDYTINATTPKENNKTITIKATIPNAKLWDGCRVRLLRWNNSTNEETKNDDKLLLDKADELTVASATQTFHYNADLGSDEAIITLTDNREDTKCDMWRYMVVCDQYGEGVLKMRMNHSNRLEYLSNAKVQFTEFMATKGESATKIKLSWKVKNKYNDKVRYVLLRARYSTNDINKPNSQIDYSNLYTVETDATSYNYTDETNPGYIYRYWLKACPICEDGSSAEGIYDDEAYDIGYAASRGTIMGKITYNSGATSVQGVDVRLTADESSLETKGSAYAFNFDQKNAVLPLAPGMGDSFWDGNWAVQFLLNPSNSDDRKRVMTLPGRMALDIQNDKLLLGQQELKINTQTFDNHIVVMHADGLYKVGITTTPANATLDYTTFCTAVSDADMKAYMTSLNETSTVDTLIFGKPLNSPSTVVPFNGYLDEVRVWNDTLDDDHIKGTFDRYITGNEEGLKAYYTFDAGVAEYAFDESHPEGIWNNHNTTLPYVNAPKLITGILLPADSVLCYRGNTDSNGEYQIAGVPFVGEGTNYKVVPIYGTHTFQPASTRRYVSAQSMTHSDVDFVDKSSFPVPIQVCYAFGNYPTSGLYIMVDGVIATKNEKQITTDAEGKATVDVPIGQHKLKITAANHIFVNSGYPCSITSISEVGDIKYDSLQDKEGYIDFQSTPTAPMTFYDNTFIRVAGRVVGGNYEADKPIGVDMSTADASDSASYAYKKSQLSKANLGAVTLTFAPTVKADKYQLNFEGEGANAHVSTGDISFIKNDTVSNGTINTSTKYILNSSKVQVTTNASTGEYLAFLPPIDMEVVDIATVGKTNGGLNKQDFNLSSSPAGINFDANTLKYDTVYLSSTDKKKVETFAYNGKKSYTYFADPKLEIYNANVQNPKDSLMMGDSIMIDTYYKNEKVGDQTKSVEVDNQIDFWSKTKRDGTSDSYMTKMKDIDGNLRGYPIFVQGSTYDINIKLYEKYTNYESGKDTTYYMDGVKMVIHNDLATTNYTALETSYSIDTSKVEDQTAATEDGALKYSFVAGFPNPSAPYTLPLSITFFANGKEYAPNEGKIEGIVIGSAPIPGADFVTEGPNQVDFVLRDPPGSGSYSWLDKGSSIGNTYTKKNGWVGTGTTASNFKCGTSTTIFSGTVVEQQLTLQTDDYSSKNLTLSSESSAGGQGTETLTYTTSEKIQTSTGSKYVGSNGDIYIGVSKNITFSKAHQVGFQKTETASETSLKTDGGYYELGHGVGISSTDKFSTAFSYSQYHLTTTLIPELIKLRNACVKEYISDLSTPPEKPLTGSFYFAKKGVDENKSLWEEGVDYVWVKSDEDVSSTDSVNLYSQWINGWRNAIKKNEETKYTTPQEFSSKMTYKDEQASSLYSPTTEFGFMGNTSIDAGDSKTVTMTRSYTNNSGSYGSNTESEQFTAKVHFSTFLGFGWENSTSFTEKMAYVGNWSNQRNTTNTQTMGYSLSDAQPGNYFSLDVYLPGKKITKTELVDTGNGAYPVTTTEIVPNTSEFFVFRLRGGQSKCPYEGVENSLFYTKNDKPVEIGAGTVAIESPAIKITNRDIMDVPNGQSCTTTVTFSNTSSATVKVPPAFNFIVDPGSNPKGLQVYVDGQVVSMSSLYQMCLLPGQSITKTVEFKQTDESILEYDDVVLRLCSDCQPAGISACDTIRVHFKPASSPVAIVQSSQTVNGCGADTTVTMTVSGYQMDYKKFSGIRIQYKKETALDWSTYTVLVKNSDELLNIVGKANFPDPWMQLEDGKMNVKVNMANMDDGNYLFRAQSFSAISPTEQVTTESSEVSVTKDTEAPKLLTTPMPTNGYYTTGSEISLQFNEPINMSKLSDYNFYVQGALNDADVTHMCGLHFNGATPARTSSRVSIYDNSRTIAMWYKPQPNKNSCLLSQTIKTTDNNDVPIRLYYNADATLSLYFGTKEFRSQKQALRADGKPFEDWMYLAMIVDQSTNKVHIYNLYDTHNVNECNFLELSNERPNVSCNVPLYVGGSASDKDSCYADIEGLCIYEDAETIATINANKDTKNTNLRGLTAYWPMDEGEGMVAVDKIRSRNLYLQGTDNWYLPVTNYALNLNGTDQYLKLDTKSVAIGKDEDYVLEFWFKTDNKANQTIFSNGWGSKDSPEDAQTKTDRLSISLNAEGSIMLAASGKDYVLGSGYNDNNWHHLALNVQRDAFATVYVDTIEIGSVSTIAGTELGGFANSNMMVGALGYYDASQVGVLKVSNYFKGSVDEVRIWNTYKTVQSVKRLASQRLSGSEVGLRGYYPFEYTKEVAKQIVVEPTLDDQIAEDKVEQIKPASTPEFVTATTIAAGDLVNTGILTDEGPRLKAASYRSTVAVEWTTNGTDKITFKFPETLDQSRIEECTLNFGAKNIEDMAGNPIKQAISWNVYVRQRALSWYNYADASSSMSFLQNIGESATGSITIVNSSSEERSWSVSYIPSWAKLSATSGTLSPWSSTSITVTTNDGTSIGNHHGVMYLDDAQNNISQSFDLSLSVIGVEPDWKVIQATDDKWMALMGRLKIENKWANDENDIVAAFDEEGNCHGMASPVYSEDMNMYFLQMNIVGSFPENSDKIYFRVWDANTGLTYTDVNLTYVQQTEKNVKYLTFMPNTVLGNFSNPCILNASEKVCQTINLNQGWNWVSLWIDPQSLKASDIFASVKDKVLVKTRLDSYGENVSGYPLANLTLSPAMSYHIWADEDLSLTLEGPSYDADTIQISLRQPNPSTSWNWLGFPISRTMILSEAFADFRPVKGDVILTQNGYSMFNGTSWTGNVKYLKPGEGYIYGYNGSSSTTWNYPGNSALVLYSGSTLEAEDIVVPYEAASNEAHFTLGVDPYSYADYTFVEATIRMDGVQTTHDYELAAFTSDGICHGVESVKAGDKCALAIFGEAGEQYTFRMWDKTTQTEIALDGILWFDASTPIISLDFNATATGIRGNVLNNPCDADYYSVGGIKYGQKPIHQGIYIKNNKKVLIK